MKTVAVSGHFVYFHLGHLRMIQEAKKLGDKLIVIVSNDFQHKLKKGKIIMTQDERAEIIRALRDVDEVVISIDKDRSSIKTLEMLKPDIYANGGDRTKDEIPEAEICKKLRIKMIDGVGGSTKIDSSSRFIEEFNRE